MDNEYNLWTLFGIVIGILIATVFITLGWLTFEVKHTTTGKPYIETHSKCYQLVSDKPMDLKTDF